MKKIFLILFVICFSCAEQKSTQFDMYGISFTYPSDWKVTDTADFGSAKYISIEKKGLTSSGIITMSFTSEDFELDEYLQFLQELLEEQDVLENLVFQKTKETQYGKYKGISSPYTFNVSSIKHEGEIYVFEENGITMGLIQQEATEDHKKNLNGFETIKESLSL